jgi:hypothetical protein
MAAIDATQMAEVPSGDDEMVPVPAAMFERGKPTPHVKSFQEYEKLYAESIKDPAVFWGKVSQKKKTFFMHWIKTINCSFACFWGFRWQKPSWTGSGPSAPSELEPRNAETLPGSWAVV